VLRHSSAPDRRVAERSAVDGETFAREVVGEYRPIILRGQVRHWAAVRASGGGDRAMAEYLAAFGGGKPLDDESVKAVIAQAEDELVGKGRLVIRPSGTEPVIRVMAEGDDPGQVERVVDRICDAVRKVAA